MSHVLSGVLDGLHRAVLDSIPAHIALLARDGTILTVNASWQSFARENGLGDPAAAAGGNYLEVTRRAGEAGDRLAHAAQEGLGHVLKGTRRMFALEYPCHTPFSERWFLLRVSAVDNGDPVAAMVMHTNITDRKLTERHIIESEQRFRAIFETSLDAIVLQDDHGTIVNVNEAAMQMAGRTRDQLVGQPGWVLEGGESEDYWKAWRLFLRTGERRCEMRIATANGPVDVECVARARILPRLHMSSLRNITDRKRLEQQFLQAQKMETVGRLAGGVAHDFNNMLTAIIGYADSLTEHFPEGDPRRQDLDEIQAAGLRAAALTRQLLTFSRQQMPTPELVDTNQVVGGIRAMLARMIGEDIVINTMLADDLPKTRIAPGQLEQVIANLAVNARDAMKGGGSLQISTARVTMHQGALCSAGKVLPGEYVELSVTDTGTGVPDDVLPHIFEPFFSTKPVGEGSGLGLATCYGIVTQARGHLDVQSRAGAGTTVIVRLPVAEN